MNFFKKNKLLAFSLFFLFTLIVPQKAGANPLVWVIEKTLGVELSLSGIVAAISSAVIWVFSWVLWFASLIFNVAIDISILKFSTIAELPFVESSWEIVRDVANMFFIFILLYIAIGTIFQLSSVNTKVMLRNVIIVALLVNFSAFGTKILIDASNILSIGIYNQIKTDNTAFGMKDLSVIFASSAGLEKAVVKSSNQSGNTAIDEKIFEGKQQTGASLNILIKTIISLLTMLWLSVIFIIVTILLLIRALVFILLIIFSPMALMGVVLPFLKSSITNKWIQQMKSNFIFAPVFMFFLFLSTKMTNELNQLKDSFGQTVTFPDINTILTSFFVVGMLTASLIIAKSMGNAGIGFATKTGGGLAFGSLAWAGRNTAGRVSQKIKNNEDLQKMATEGGVRGALGRMTLKTAAKADKGSFDIRGSRLAKSTIGTSGLDVGEAKSGGYKAQKEGQIKKEVDFANENLKKVSDKKDASGKTYRQIYAENLKERKSLHRIPLWGARFGVPSAHKEAAKKVGLTIQLKEAYKKATNNLSLQMEKRKSELRALEKNPTTPQADIDNKIKQISIIKKRANEITEKIKNLNE